MKLCLLQYRFYHGKVQIMIAFVVEYSNLFTSLCVWSKDFEFSLWDIENGKTNGITNWSKLCEQYNWNKENDNTTLMNTYALF